MSYENICSKWAPHQINIDGHQVTIKINEISGDWIIMGPCEATTILNNKIRPLHENYAGLSYAEFLIRLFGECTI